ncbi:MAG TPA: hypothetical protein VFV84_09825 [Burkholderiales bacterium]|nr:hypothetical protein [Burkholderiales bacterium]
MPLLGSAAMLLNFDILAESVAEHDDWHTHEHFPERLSIPGFVRGTRWTAVRGAPRYFVLYEVAGLGVLTSPAYLARLNQPTPWTRKMMASYRGMRRGFCAVTGSFGAGLGQAARLLHFKPGAQAAPLRDWLLGEHLPALPSKPGFTGAHLLEAAATPPMTDEQKIRGADASVDWAIVLAGYDEDALAGADLRELERHGATGLSEGLYRLHYSLAREG